MGGLPGRMACGAGGKVWFLASRLGRSRLRAKKNMFPSRDAKANDCGVGLEWSKPSIGPMLGRVITDGR